MGLGQYMIVGLLTMLTVTLIACSSAFTPTSEPTVTVPSIDTGSPSPTVSLTEPSMPSETVIPAQTPTQAPSPTTIPTPTSTPEPTTVTVIDDLGREVEIPYRPKRLAVTSAFMVELTMACGYRPVARPDISPEYIYPLEAHDIPAFGVSHSAGPNLEQLAVAQPDLVISSPTYSQFIPSIEETLGVPVLVHDVSSVDGIIQKIRTYGMLVGCEAKAEEASQDLLKRISVLQDGLPETGPKVFAIFGTSQSFLGFMPTSYLGDMVGLLGGSLITEGEPAYVSSRTGASNPKYTTFSMEKVIEKDPDVILVVRHGDPSEAREENFASLLGGPAWSGLRAVQEGRVHELSEWLYVRYPGPRVILAMEELRSVLYPEE